MPLITLQSIARQSWGVHCSTGNNTSEQLICENPQMNAKGVDTIIEDRTIGIFWKYPTEKSQRLPSIQSSIVWELDVAGWTSGQLVRAIWCAEGTWGKLNIRWNSCWVLSGAQIFSTKLAVQGIQSCWDWRIWKDKWLRLALILFLP